MHDTRLLVGAEISSKKWRIPVGEKAYWGNYKNKPHFAITGGFYVIQMAEDFEYRIGWTNEALKTPKIAEKGKFLCIPRGIGGAGGITVFDSFSDAKATMGHLVRKNVVEDVKESYRISYESYLKSCKEKDEKKEVGEFDGEMIFHNGAKVGIYGTFESQEEAVKFLKGMTVKDLIDSKLIKDFTLERR